MYEINLERHMWTLKKDKERVLKAYLKSGKAIEEFEEKHKGMFYPTLVYNKDGELIRRGLFNSKTIKRIKWE